MKLIKILNEVLKESKYNLAGNCVTGLDDPYFQRRICSDATEMAGVVDEYSNEFLTKDKFLSKVNWSEKHMGPAEENRFDFAYNPQKDIYWAYDIEEDVHYFFVKDRVNENYKHWVSAKTIFENDEKSYVYVGTCMNSFDEFGACKHGAFYDEEHFFNSWQNAKEISKEEFWKHIDPSSDMYNRVKRLEADPKYTPEYRYSSEDDIYFIFVSDDTHYFFVRK